MRHFPDLLALPWLESWCQIDLETAFFLVKTVLLVFEWFLNVSHAFVELLPPKI